VDHPHGYVVNRAILVPRKDGRSRLEGIVLSFDACPGRLVYLGSLGRLREELGRETGRCRLRAGLRDLLLVLLPMLLVGHADGVRYSSGVERGGLGECERLLTVGQI
jgi:hypothetical protein